MQLDTGKDRAYVAKVFEPLKRFTGPSIQPPGSHAAERERLTPQHTSHLNQLTQSRQHMTPECPVPEAATVSHQARACGPLARRGRRETHLQRVCTQTCTSDHGKKQLLHLKGKNSLKIYIYMSLLISFRERGGQFLAWGLSSTTELRPEGRL